MVRAAERRPDFDHPVRLPETTQEAIEHGWPLKDLKLSRQAELLAAEAGSQQGEKLTAEHSSQHAPRKKETIAAVYPAGAIGRESPGWNQTMQMRVMQHFLIPGMEHGQESEIHTEPALIPRNREQSL